MCYYLNKVIIIFNQNDKMHISCFQIKNVCFVKQRDFSHELYCTSSHSALDL